MKTLIFILSSISLVFLSCERNNEINLSDRQKESIKSEIAPIMNQIIENSQSADFDKAIEPYLNSQNFMAISSGQVMDYQNYYKLNKEAFKGIESQKFTESLMDYKFLNDKTVIVTWGGSAITKLRDGQLVKVDPFAASLVFAKSDNGWKVIYTHESGVSVPMDNDSIKRK